MHTISPNVRICVFLILKLFEGIYLSKLRCYAIDEYFNKKNKLQYLLVFIGTDDTVKVP